MSNVRSDVLSRLLEQGRKVIKQVESANLLAVRSTLEQANRSFLVLGYYVTTREISTDTRKPIYLHLSFSNGKSNIPIGPIVTISTKAISDRVALYFNALEQKAYIDGNGTIFDFSGVKVETFADYTFKIEGKTVTYKDRPLSLLRITSPHVIKFFKFSNSHVELYVTTNCPNKHRFFIDDLGRFYRV